MKILRIKLVHQKDFNNYLQNEEEIILSVIAETSDLGDVNITGDDSLNVFSLDQDNFYLIPDSNNGTRVKFLPKAEGSGVIKAIYSYNGEKFYTSKQFLCHKSFFKDNYLTYLVPTLDAQNIESNQFLKSIFDTLMEMLDILYAYNEDLKIISNFKYGKSKFISLLAQNVGFERIDFTQFNTKYEFTNNETFREIISNIFDLLSVRGTHLAYELFFNALGYNITMQEFWYDSDGNLIEINSEDESLSTFFAYGTGGELLDNPPLPRLDPRKYNPILSNDNNSFSSPYIRILNSDGTISFQKNDDIIINKKNNSITQNVFVNNKSNYVRLILNNSINDDYFESPGDFSPEKRKIIKTYLEFLRPSHIQYITELLGKSFPDDIFDNFAQLNDDEFYHAIMIEFKKDLIDSIENTYSEDLIDNFNVGSVKNIIDDFYYNKKWDTLLKYDNQNTFDYKNVVEEEFKVDVI
jgi:hypothetical protein